MTQAMKAVTVAMRVAVDPEKLGGVDSDWDLIPKGCVVLMTHSDWFRELETVALSVRKSESY